MGRLIKVEGDVIITRSVVAYFEDNGVTEVKEQAEDALRDEAGVSPLGDEESEIVGMKLYATATEDL